MHHPIGHLLLSILTHTFSADPASSKDSFINLHDPAVIQYALDQYCAANDTEYMSKAGWKRVVRDVRIECDGNYTRGMLLADDRSVHNSESDLKYVIQKIKNHKDRNLDDGGWIVGKKNHVGVVLGVDGPGCSEKIVTALFLL